MSDKKREENLEADALIDFEEAKDMTVGQAIRKNEEVEAGVLPDDTLLDKYVKQHRDEIEADKFDSLKEEQENLEIVAEDVKKEESEELEEPSPQSLDDIIQEAREELETDSEEDKDSLFDMDHFPALESQEEELAPFVPDEQGQVRKLNKKVIAGAVVASLAVLLLGGTFYVYRQVTRSTQEIEAAQSSASGLTSPQAAVDEFNALYDAFYTDTNKTALKNNHFNQLAQLNTALSKLEGSREHTLTKSKYDSLESQIKAVQAINDQFDTPVIVDGVLQESAKLKEGASVSEVKTGNTDIDAVLAKAYALARSQEKSSQSTASSTSSSSQTSTAASSSATETSRTTAPTTTAGLSSAGVSLQRSVSRVPYNQASIDDSSNPAWDFASGVLEQILETSRSRGYITGNQYILEKVAIVNGNGYYNLYKPDGTYLFTLNCKTGYFVGNGSGHANDLDY